MARPDLLAAVDLGSNSFHLQVGRVVGGQIYPLDTLREVVRLGAGLTAEKRIDRATQARALDALQRIGERLRGLPRSAVRAVGTNALRVAKNAPQFLREARAALGFPIEVIAGREEARLIYLGVAHSMPPSTQNRLVVDIGGGSTEFIIGKGLEPLLTESLYMGCVSYSLAYFPDGRVEKSRMKKAELAARQELAGMVREYREQGWQEAAGSSGTARALEAILRENGFTDDGITLEGLERLKSVLIKHERADPDRIAGLRKDRAPVLPGGLAIMLAAFSELKIERMAVSDGALRHGVLYDLLGRVQHRDMREATVAEFMRRHHVDTAQAERVRSLALKIFDSITAEKEEQETERLLLDWAARLAEIGLSVAHAQYHKHSAYILSNADMPGFSKMEQAQLSLLVLAHRGSLDKLRGMVAKDVDWTLLVALRLAALLHRSRSEVRLPVIHASKKKSTFTVELDARWLAANSLTAAELRDEIKDWNKLGIELSVPELAELETEAMAGD